MTDDQLDALAEFIRAVVRVREAENTVRLAHQIHIIEAAQRNFELATDTLVAVWTKATHQTEKETE